MCEGGATVAKELIFVSQSRGEPVCLISWMNLRTARAVEDRKKSLVFFFIFRYEKIYIVYLFFPPPQSPLLLLLRPDRLNYFFFFFFSESCWQRNIIFFPSLGLGLRMIWGLSLSRGVCTRENISIFQVVVQCIIYTAYIWNGSTVR